VLGAAVTCAMLLSAGIGDSLPGLVLDAVNESIPGTITAGTTRFSAPSTAIFEDTVLTGHDGATIGRIARLTATVSISELLGGNLVVTDLLIQQPNLDLKMQDGHLNLERAFVVIGGKKAPSEKASTEIRIEKARVESASVTYKDPGKLEVRANDISGTGRVEVYVKTGQVFVTAGATRVDRGRVVLPDLDVPFRRLFVDGFRLRTTNIAVDALRVQAAGASVVGSARIKLSAEGELKVDLAVNAPSGAWPDRLERPPFALPDVNAAVNVTGAFAQPVVDAKGTFTPFVAYELPFGRGSFDVRVTSSLLTLRDVKAAMGSKGQVVAAGTLQLSDKRADIDATLEQVPIGLLAGPAKLSPAPRGVAYGPITVDGIVDGKAPLEVGATLQVYGLKAFDLVAPSPTRLRTRATVTAERITLGQTRVSGEGLEAIASGTIYLEEERLLLDVGAELAAPGDVVPQIPADVVMGATRFDGQVVGPFERVRADGRATVSRVDAYGVPVVDVAALVTADARQASVRDIVANTAGGQTTGWVRVGLTNKGALEGELHVTKAALERVALPGAEDIPLTGLVDVEVRLGHLTSDPLIKAQVVGHRVTAREEQLGEVRASAWITPRDVRVASLSVAGPVLTLQNAGEVAIDLERERLAGVLVLERVQLDAIRAAQAQQLAGQAKGPIVLGGALDAPDVRARLELASLGVQGIPLGDGPAVIRFLADAASPADAREHLLLVSTELSGPRGTLDARAGLAVEREVINAEATLNGVDLGPWLELAGRDERGRVLLPWQGEAAIDATITGALDDPTIKARVDIAELAIPSPPTAPLIEGAVHRFSNETRQWDTRGPVSADVTFIGGELEAIVCAFPSFDGQVDNLSVCERGERLWADITGPYDTGSGAFDLTAVFGLQEARVQTFAAALADANLGVDTIARGHVHLTRIREDAEPIVRGNVLLDRLVITSPETAPVVLREPREIELTPSGALFFNLPPDAEHLNDRAPLRFLTGESALEVAGADTGALNLTTRRLSTSIDGNIALALIKPFSEEIQAAGGEVEAHVALGGTFDQPEVVGALSPTPGAFVTPRALGRRVELKGGTLTTRIVEEDRNLLEVLIDPDNNTLEVALDDGRAALEGSVLIDMREGAVARWDLHAFGSGLFFRLGRGYVETAFDASMVMVPSPNADVDEGDEALQPQLQGRVEINDGQVKETFQLKNFVITKDSSERRSKPLREVLNDVNLADLGLDIAVVVQNFDARANLATFRADGALRGEVQVTGYAVAPAVSGAVEVVDGAIQFPYARFEVMQTQVTFPPAKDGRINPEIFLSARGELEPPRNGLDTEVPCLLTLDGNLDQMSLKLEAEATEYNFTEGALLRYVLLGTKLSTGAVVTDADAALRAVSSELTAAFSRDLEQAIAEQLGAQLSFSVFYEDGQLKGGVRYQLGERLEFDGEAAFANVGGGAGTSNGGNVTEARIRLLLVDHMPYVLGRDLAFEGHVTTGDGVNTQASTNLRLSYRFFEF
jgi:hypothetical protein